MSDFEGLFYDLRDDARVCLRDGCTRWSAPAGYSAEHCRRDIEAALARLRERVEHLEALRAGLAASPRGQL